jgi:dihydrofolate reductase
MARIVVSQFITLDGVVEDPGGSESFALGGWNFESLNDEYFNYRHSELFSCGALLLGRVTFEALEAAWPLRSDVTGLSARMNSLHKYVVSSVLSEGSWTNSSIIKSPIVQNIAGLRQQLRNDLLVIGSTMLVRLLMKHDLIDEYRLLLHPLVLGSGRKLFEEGEIRKLKLAGTLAFATGVVVLTYVPDRSRIVEMRTPGAVVQAFSSSR